MSSICTDIHQTINGPLSDQSSKPNTFKLFKQQIELLLQSISSSLMQLIFTIVLILNISFIYNYDNSALLGLYFLYCAYTLFSDNHKNGGWESKPYINLMRIVFTDRCSKHLDTQIILDEKDKKSFSGDGGNIFAMYPHGVWSLSSVLNFSRASRNLESVLPNLEFKLCTLNLNFRVPFLRDHLLSCGFISADKNSIKMALGENKAVGIVVGGAKESMFAKPGKNTIVLKNRKGFVKLAIETGATLVPVYNFGENCLYNQISNDFVSRVQESFASVFSFVPVLFYGSVGPFVPMKCKIRSVVGKPIKVIKNMRPTQKEVDFYHELYVAALKDIFVKYKDEYDYSGEDLILV